jgi:hypothetical protein
MPTLLLKPSGGKKILLRDQSQAPYYPTPVVLPVAADVFVHFADEPPSAARYVRTVGPGEEVRVPYNPVADKPLVVRAVARGPDGTPDVNRLEHASAATFLFNREDIAPTVVQIGASTTTTVDLSITGFTRFAVARRVRVWSDAGLTTLIATITVDKTQGQPLADVFRLNRAGLETSDPLTRYVKVSHSSAGVNGPWGPESAALAITFAGDGGGGSSGGGTHYPYDGYEVP